MIPTSDLSLQEWLCLLEQRHEQGIQLGLDRIKTVADRLSLCVFNSKVITVSGTNGKGSTVAALDAIYHAAGFSVGCYTSPHLLVFNERICVNQKPISDADLCTAFAVIEHLRGDILLTYFEMTTLAAFYYFKQYALDVIILEVGMGGRLDATNIVDADLAIITTVDFDHQDYLGHTLEAIAYEKAGILRANRPFIYADYEPPNSVIEWSGVLHAPMICLGVDYSFDFNENTGFVLQDRETVLTLPKPAIQLKAASAAIVASHVLQSELPVSVQALQQAMREVGLLGRQQVVSGDVTVVYDVAHNPQAVFLLAEFIKKLPVQGQVHAVFSGLADKDLRGLITGLRECVDVWYPACLTGNRAASDKVLLAAFNAEKIIVEGCFSHPFAAFSAAREQAHPGDLIVVYGSFLTVSAIMSVENENYQGRCDESCNR
jgi:dihydrofolate synthase / folylpolyglutamate synthase